jgi:hypothetical protein
MKLPENVVAEETWENRGRFAEEAVVVRCVAGQRQADLDLAVELKVEVGQWH